MKCRPYEADKHSPTGGSSVHKSQEKTRQHINQITQTKEEKHSENGNYIVKFENHGVRSGCTGAWVRHTAITYSDTADYCRRGRNILTDEGEVTYPHAFSTI